MIVLGFTGTFAAGKDTAIAIISRKFGAKAMEVSTSNLVREETTKRGLSLERENLRQVANDMRLSFGADIFGKMTIQRIKQRGEKKVFLVSGIRSVGEVESLKKEFGTNFCLIAVDAPLETRYQRIKARARAGEHVMTLDEFKASEEMEKNGEVHSQNIASVMKMADYTIQNSGSSKQLEEKVEKILEKVMK
ncbi:MAG: AAA family ATPase [Candidatus Micrarchaeota archaeon]|nr:AAA family ATPase [Candidatus Micrarchaeota archaeon]